MNSYVVQQLICFQFLGLFFLLLCASVEANLLKYNQNGHTILYSFLPFDLFALTVNPTNGHNFRNGQYENNERSPKEID